MKYWQVISWCETEHIVEVAKHAEAVGFEGIILAEHVYYPKEARSHYYYSEDGLSPQDNSMEFPDPLISFAAASSVTTKLKMMTGIYVLPLRHPVEAAKNMATLAKLSDNRFLLGVGAGWLEDEFSQFNIEFKKRGQRMDEMLDIMEELWTGSPVSHTGDHFNLKDIQIRPYPSKSIPVMGGGHSERAIQRAVQRCHGWYGPGNTVDELKKIVPALKHARIKTKQAVNDFEIIAPVTEELTEEKCEELQHLGVTGTVSYPFLFGIGPNSSLEDKKEYMSRFSDAFIRHGT